MNVGFTGTHRGMTEPQKYGVRRLLTNYLLQMAGQRVRFRHGLCVGSDDQSACIAHELGFYVIAYPGFPPKDPENLSNRGLFQFNDEVMPAGPFLDRDKLIVDASSIMLATPFTKQEVIRSGTWATVRYARRVHKPVILIYPDGEMSAS